MKSLSAVLIASLALTGSIQAKTSPLTFYADRTRFDVAEPGLPVQSFTGANMFGQPYVTQPSPLSASTNDGVFAAGSILPGLMITTVHPGSKTTALAVISEGPLGTVSVGDNWFGDTLVLSFPSGVAAVGENLFANTAYGTSFAGTVTVQYYSGKKLLGSKKFTEAAGGYVFAGVSSSGAPITAVAMSWDGNEDASVFVSSIAFGTP